MNTKTESQRHPSVITPPKTKIDLWKECDVNKLVEHFHRYDKRKDNGHGQVERLGMLSLDREKRGRLFPKKTGAAGEKITITSFHISFGLDEKESPVDKFTFRPSITVVFSDNSMEHAEFDQDMPMEGSQISNEIHNNVVPSPFKEWLSKNWMELDVNLIDDVFVAFSNNPPLATGEKRLVPPRREPLRLRGYHFTSKDNEEFWKFMNDHLGSIDEFYFHLGIDMNKFGHKEEFSFSPVFEVIIPEPAHDVVVVRIHRYGLRSTQIVDKNGKVVGESVLYEYMKPCPSTCD